MKLDRVTLHQIRMPLVHFFETSFSRTYSRDIILVEVSGDGFTGWGEVTAGENPFYNEEWTTSAWSILHDYATFNWIMTGTDTFAVEGTSAGQHLDGSWRAGVSHAGRWCDVFEIRDFLIQRCFIYLDPDYAGLDTARYPWLSAERRDPSKPMG